MDKLLENLGLLIALILYHMINKWWEKRQKAQESAKKATNSSITTINEINREVTHETKKIRDRHQAMRVYVIHFSNGTVMDSGLHLLKITFKHEAVLDWGPVQVESISKNFQEVPVPDMFLSPMTIALRTGEYYLKDRRELNTNEVPSRDYHDWLKAYGVMSSLWTVIKKKGKPVAILVSHWPVATHLDGALIARIKDINRNIEKVYDKIQI